MGLSPGVVRPKTKTGICCFSATLCIDGHFKHLNKINNYLSPQIIEHKKTKMQTDLAWDRHNNVKVLNWLIEPSLKN